MKREIISESGSGPVADALKGLLKGRADAYEIFFSYDKGFSVEAKEGAVDAMKVRSGRGVGLRTISGKRLGFGFSSVLSDDALKALVDNTLTGGMSASEDENLRFAVPLKNGVEEEILDIFDPAFGAGSEDERIRTAALIESGALAHDARIKRVRKASYSESVHTSYIFNSNGVEAFHAATYYSGSVTAVAEENGESQMGWEIGMGHKRGLIEPEKIGQAAAINALRLLGARKINTVKCPAVVENTVACELLESLAVSFLGDNVAKGKSMLAGKTGQKVASPSVTIWDDGLLQGGWATSAVDGEGVASCRTPLVTGGVLNGYLYDSYWAARAGTNSTGNASRSNFKGVPGVGISNLYIETGRESLEELFKGMDKGLFITEVLGVHTINTVSGDFSLGAAGFWVEGGKLAYPVRGLAIAGNLLDLFLKVAGCGSDMRFIGSIGSPSLLLSEIEASGS